MTEEAKIYKTPFPLFAGEGLFSLVDLVPWPGRRRA
jgi:hypothetical protein